MGLIRDHTFKRPPEDVGGEGTQGSCRGKCVGNWVGACASPPLLAFGCLGSGGTRLFADLCPRNEGEHCLCLEILPALAAETQDSRSLHSSPQNPLKI